ncbi:MAG TPA: DUF6036 family nucleotidyltransferase [Thermoanaerobaculia bacterium]|jgi:hypothetical protein|nr:DUF6036 family nucleotidyltransferase [Thermoanaerobaculia bacterium]
MNRHFVEMLSALSDAGADYLVIGAHALAAHGYARGTKDLDIWVRPTPQNAARVWRALLEFGAPLEQLTVADLFTPGTICQIGVDPARIDLLTSPAGVDFEESWQRRLTVTVKDREFAFIGRDDLIASKRAAGRPNDFRDIDELERLPQ